MLYVARVDRPEQHRGAVVQIERSPFAPSDLLLRDAANGVLAPVAFRARYAWELRALWKRDRQAFLALIEQARGGRDVTLVDAWEDEAYTPRRVLAAALKQIASVEQANARRRERDRQRREGLATGYDSARCRAKHRTTATGKSARWWP